MSKTKSSSDTFDVESFEARLESLKDTQDGIQQMSAWCLQHRSHHKQIVASWLNVFKKVRVEHRLVLFYLANDVIQYSKRKRYEFVESWVTALQRATTMVRDDKVKNKILRIFQIWEQRDIFSEEYISDLNGLLNITPVKKSQSAPETTVDFQSKALIAAVQECVELSNATDLSFKKMPKQPSCDMENYKQYVKDRSHSEEVMKEIQQYLGLMDAYIQNLQAEIRSRKSVLTNLESAVKFYAYQRGEVKVVVNAYKQFGSRVKMVKKKVDELGHTLPSPIPSPDINAPSPEPDADLQLPDEQSPMSANMFQNSFNGYTSYLDGNLPFDINDFKREEKKHTTSKSTTSIASQPIEVIASRPDANQNDAFNSSSNYYKPESISAYPGNSNVEIPGLSPMPVPPVHSEYSSLARSAQQYGIISAPHQPLFTSKHNNNNNNINRNYETIMSTYSSDNGGGYHHSNSSTSSSFNGGNNATATPRTVGSGGMPLMPPPLPPSSLRGSAGVGSQNSNDDFNASWDVNLQWNRLDRTSAITIDTPVSPPHFERKPHGNDNETAAYVDVHENSLSTAQDIDHRQLHLSTGVTSVGIELNLSKEKTRQLDIDHRNLIALTGSPSTHDHHHDALTNEKSSWLTKGDKDFRTSKTFGDVDYRSSVRLGQTIQTIDTTPPSSKSSIGAMKPPPTFASVGTQQSSNKVLSQNSSPPQISNASSSSESQKEDAGGGASSGYDPSDMVVDMDMSDEDLEEIFREVNEKNQEEAEAEAQTSTGIADSCNISAVESKIADERIAASASSRPPLLETPAEYVTPNSMWEQTASPIPSAINMPFQGAMTAMDNMGEHQSMPDPMWSPLSYNEGGGAAMYPPHPPRMPFPMPPQHMAQPEHQQQFPAHFMGGVGSGGGGVVVGGGGGGGVGGSERGMGGNSRGRGRGWVHTSPNPFRNPQRGAMRVPPGSPYFNRAGRAAGGMRGGPFRGKFRGNNAWI